MIKVIVGEDHQILRDGLKSLMKDNVEITFIAEANNGKELIDKLADHTPDVALIDINMPVMNGLETAKYLREHHSAIRVLIFSMMDHENYVAEMFLAGAKGYILKNAGKDELIYAIKRVYAGGLYVSPEITIKVLNKICEENSPVKENPLLIRISKRETEVLNLLAEGFTNNEIAEKLFTSRRTVETHRKNLIEKTGAKNTAALIKFAILNKILK